MLFRNTKSVLMAFVAVLLLASCNRALNMLESGDYDSAIYFSIKKLSGKKKKKEKYVSALEEAFAKATKADMYQIAKLQKEGREENWVEINALHQQIRRRQEAIEPLLPLYSDKGVKAEFSFVRIGDLEIESKDKAADFYYGEGKRLLAEGERGDKEAARNAYDSFDKIKRYYKRYKDEDKLMEKALDLGTVHVLFSMENESRQLLPRDFEREIKRMTVKDLDSRWRQVHLNPESGFKYDYNVVMNLTQIDVSADIFKEREYVDDTTIEDGWEYVLDKNGNVVKDTSGNDVKVPKKVLIKAYVLETYQSKAAHVGGRLEFFDNRTKELIKSEPMAVDAVFENYAATFRGDKRALTEDSKKKIGNRPVPFPSSESLVLQAAEMLKPVIKNKIANSRILI